VTVIPNWVDDEQLDRSKLPGARFHLGMIGVGESRKRFDIALDVVEAVRRRDERFVLFAKTKMPWEYPWIYRRPGEPEHARAVLRRIQGSPGLRGSVVFDPFGPEVGTWLRRVGFILSTSDDESFHLAPAEGMASRAVPVIRGWPGADAIYDQRWIHRDAAEMADAILALADERRWAEAGAAAREQVRASFSLERVVRDWTDLIARDGPS
jgi:glycosyltransferase involved in cell wall biosynthesis